MVLQGILFRNSFNRTLPWELSFGAPRCRILLHVKLMLESVLNRSTSFLSRLNQLGMYLVRMAVKTWQSQQVAIVNLVGSGQFLWIKLM